MFIKTLDGDWINADHVIKFDVIRTADNAFTSRAHTTMMEVVAIHKTAITGFEGYNEEQSWLDCYIHEIGLD